LDESAALRGVLDYRTFDTHAAVKKLVAAGMPDEQAEAQVEILSEVLSANLGELATKQDLKELEEALRRDLEDVRRDMEEREQGLRHVREQLGQGLRRDMHETQRLSGAT
jgi:hypothetical protein